MVSTEGDSPSPSTPPRAPRIAAIGEVLWDRFPDSERLGGAPANAALHAAALGADALLVSRVGDDVLGRETVRLLSERTVDTSHVQVDTERPTGAAVVTVDAAGEPAFEIVENVAWDAVEWTDDLGSLAASLDAVVFGTLGQRLEPSRSTIRRFVDACPPTSIRCLDLNLRQHYHSPEVIDASLRLANTLKLNRAELDALASQYGLPGKPPRTVDALREAFSLRWVALTLGSDGCRVFAEGVDATIPGTPVAVEDTVGAGDAFTAALLTHLLIGSPLEGAGRPGPTDWADTWRRALGRPRYSLTDSRLEAPEVRAVADQRAWTAETAGSLEEWTKVLPESCLEELRYLADAVRNPPYTITREDAPLTAAFIQDLLTEVVSGRGFGILDGLDVSDEALARRVFWFLGQLIGRPLEQNVQGEVLYDVTDKGGDVASGARFSVTNAESTFHTDGAFFTSMPDVIGLLCLRTARSGGESQLLSAAAIHDAVLSDSRSSLETLYGRFLIDRRGQFHEGESPALEVSVFSRQGNELTMRYLRAYIDIAHRDAGKPLLPEQVEALEHVERLLSDPRFRVAFHLKPGQVLFTNNHWVLHNRTAFVDHVEPSRKRHYVRLWLRTVDVSDDVTEAA